MQSKIILTALTILMTCAITMAQSNSETITIPLSTPGQPGTLDINLHDGTVTVEGYSGTEVLLDITSTDKGESKTSKSGLKRIPNNAMNVTISEEDNEVYISGSHSKRTDFVVKVPKNFSLSIKTHHNGYIKVSNISGEIDARGHHGGIKLTDISGSAVAETHHGAITVNFLSVTPGKPMGFSTYHGDVDITFPPSINGSLKMKTTKGEILTDFEMVVEKPKVEKRATGRKNEIKLSGWTYGSIGSGGKELMFTSYHGDILIRKG